MRVNWQSPTWACLYVGSGGMCGGPSSIRRSSTYCRRLALHTISLLSMSKLRGT